jgi:ribonuclease J
VRGFESTNGNGSNRRTQVSSYEGSKQLVKDAQRIVAAAIAGASRQTLADESLLKEHLRVELKRFIQKETGARPVIVPVIQKID